MLSSFRNTTIPIASLNIIPSPKDVRNKGESEEKKKKKKKKKNRVYRREDNVVKSKLYFMKIKELSKETGGRV